MRNNDDDVDIEDTCELLTDLQRIEDKIDALQTGIDSLVARLDAGVRAPGTRQLSALGERVRREIERRKDENPDQAIGASWLSRLLGIEKNEIKVELEGMVTDGLLYSRAFYKGKLYYRCGHGPAARARKTGTRAGDDEARLNLLHQLVREKRMSSQAAVWAVYATASQEKGLYADKKGFYATWTTLVSHGWIEKGEDGFYRALPIVTAVQAKGSS